MSRHVHMPASAYTWGTSVAMLWWSNSHSFGVRLGKHVKMGHFTSFWINTHNSSGTRRIQPGDSSPKPYWYMKCWITILSWVPLPWYHYTGRSLISQIKWYDEVLRNESFIRTIMSVSISFPNPSSVCSIRNFLLKVQLFFYFFTKLAV